MKTIKLNNYHGIGRYDDVSPFIIDEDLRIKIDGLSVTNGEYHIIAKCNGRQTSQRIEGVATIPKSFLSAGELYISVALYIKGNKVKEFACEPLTLKEVEGEMLAEPMIEALKAEIATLNQELATTKENQATAISNLRQDVEHKLDEQSRAVLEFIKTAIEEVKQSMLTATDENAEALNEKIKSVSTTVASFFTDKKKKK